MSSDDINSPLGHRRYEAGQVCKIIARVMAEDAGLEFTQHARVRMSERNITEVDVINTLQARNLAVTDGEPHSSGAYTYKCSTNKLSVVVAVRTNPVGLTVVTVVRTGRR